MIDTIGQRRARHWLERIGEVTFQIPPRSKDFKAETFWDEASSFLNGIPMDIRTSGLGLALAIHHATLPKQLFDPAKCAPKEFILMALVDWLVDAAERSGSPYEGAKREDTMRARGAALIQAVADQDAMDAMLATEEVLAWIEWGKPLVKARKTPAGDA